uniref:Vacuolar cation/proton exchanger n=1 Tax=Rhizophora mucronata TaxID=61149 RepID=A0A2P2LPJ0_RHIMU
MYYHLWMMKEDEVSNGSTICENKMMVFLVSLIGIKNLFNTSIVNILSCLLRDYISYSV